MHDSPVVDTEKPVSRQQEIAMREHWGPPACWVNSEFFLSYMPAGALPCERNRDRFSSSPYIAPRAASPRHASVCCSRG